jgi:TPR repeat protein
MIEKAIAAGDVEDGAEALGDFYREASPPDIEKATAAYRQAIDAGSTSAMLALAEMVGPSDAKLAKTMIEKAIAAGDVEDGARSLGDFYRDAEPPDLHKAAAAYRQAIDAGSTSAMLDLAEMIAPSDAKLAKTMIERAIAAGDVEDGAMALGNFYRQKTPPDIEKAIEAYQLAATVGNPSANLIAVRIGGTRNAEVMAGSLVVAARTMSPREVALEMLRFPANTMIASVQQLLSQRGHEPGRPDGRYDSRTKRAITAFCAATEVVNCDSEFVTVDLLIALLTE